MPHYPMSQVRMESFGPFQRIDLELSPRLNVLVGDNGTGKSQLLKALYACTAVLSRQSAGASAPTKSSLGTDIAEKLVGAFRPDRLGRLTNRSVGRARSEVAVKYSGLGSPLSFSFATNSSASVGVENHPGRYLQDTPVFIPTRELLSIYPGFTALYDTREVEFDETWRDTIQLLGRPALRGPRSETAREVLSPLTEVMEGAVVEEGGRFYVKRPGIGNIEAALVAEGERKLAMIVRLVSSGVLLQGGYLLWDEPEANLNPKTLKVVAVAIDALSRQGSQVVVATHSLFLLRELQMLQQGDDVRYLGLRRGENGEIDAESVPMLNDLQVIPSLEAELEQSHRYLTA